MSFGSPGAEKVVINVDSLWSGGPFESTVSIYGSRLTCVKTFGTDLHWRQPNQRSQFVSTWNS
jgi:hypothetical protein